MNAVFAGGSTRFHGPSWNHPERHKWIGHAFHRCSLHSESVSSVPQEEFVWLAGLAGYASYLALPIGITPLRCYYGPSRHRLAFTRFPGEKHRRPEVTSIRAVRFKARSNRF
jgi:hypothetical protein